MADTTYRSAFASAPFTPADWASYLEAQVTPYLPYCLPCLRSLQANSSIAPGTIVYLPSENTVPLDSIVRYQPAVNAGAYAHPGLALLESRCGHLVFVAPVTSFRGAGIQAKYNRIGAAAKNDIFWQYLVLDTHLTPAHNDLAALEIAGDRLAKPSYVHLDQGYWIEKVQLAVQGAHLGKRTTVTAAALMYAQWAYAVAEGHRFTQQMQMIQASSLAFPVVEWFGQGGLWQNQLFAMQYSLGGDEQSSWRSYHSPGPISYAAGRS
ncbi:hypothetical protein PRZ48_012173 [Zasmidium cellare]|uniref:Uncharacterized protein n=1 Tax=Zasmidium cellare TaxID=395010 RepID=A0ABR0E4J8_ZASCE|nr:hypothetical protein PRZ48_012173 [Zasmidium cellare]